MTNANFESRNIFFCFVSFLYYCTIRNQKKLKTKIMKVFIQKPTESKPKLFLFQYNRFQNGYATIYLGIYHLHFIIYTHHYIGKMKQGKRTHKTIKF